MTRRLADSRKKLRGVARRLRAVRRWASALEGCFPSVDDLSPEYRYWNLKIPVDLNLVEGRATTDEIRRVCAQSLIDACAGLLEAKPESAKDFRVTCVICTPDMFTSELCIYLTEDYFLSHTSPSSNEYGYTQAIHGRRLSQEWGLVLPPGFGEIGISVAYHSDEDDWHLVGERWYFGEVASAANNSFKPNPLRGSA